MNLPVKEGVEFRPIPGFDGYVASSEGDIWTCRYTHTGPNNKIEYRSTWYKLKPLKGEYLRVHVWKDKGRLKRRIHLLVAAAYLGPKPEGMIVRHLNDRSYDNRPSNLAYGTRKDNFQDRYKNNPDYVHSTMPNGIKQTHLHGLVAKRLRQHGVSTNIISSLFGVGLSTCRALLRNQHKSSQAIDLPIDTPTLLRVFVDKYPVTKRLPTHGTVDKLLEALV